MLAKGAEFLLTVLTYNNFIKYGINTVLNDVKLIKYQTNLSTHIYWQNRKKYVPIIKSFINDVISADDFTNEFLALWTKNRDALDTIEINFDPNPKSIGFFDIVDEIFHHCEMFEPESKHNERYSTTWLKIELKKTLFKMQKYLDEIK